MRLDLAFIRVRTLSIRVMQEQTVSNKKSIADKIRALGNYGSDYKYHHIYKGNNSRLDEMRNAFF